MGPMQGRAPGPPRYATRGNYVGRGKGGNPVGRRGLCAIRAQSLLNTACSRHSGISVKFQWLTTAAGIRLSGFLGSLLGDLALQLAHLWRQLVVTGLCQPIVEAADMLDRAQAMRRDAQLYALPKGVGNQRDVLQVRQKRALRLIVGVGNIVSPQPALAGQLANPRH